ncbi:hypothetical protein Clacol_007095 [Clathrus columnatus]|uniref:Choline dehydrogenase n=1 Tax=Clathrus columnatus TaxID=1419009 RepID=A0AAV5ALP8_9AGAM|nr:hypothetical protein Clacol_007095 [Clathrus columnatus]
MWPYKTYRTVQICDLQKSYDYIIIGGGSAGCVITNRLSEDPNVSVLLIEKGDLSFSWASYVPLLSCNFQSSGVRSKKYGSVPQKNLGDTVSEIVIGNALGGSSRINGMVYTRGLPAQFTNWTEQGLKGWSYDDLHPYFLKPEGAIGIKQSTNSHNISGEWKNRSISSPKCYFPTAEAAIKAAEDLDFPVITDFNSLDQPIFGMAKLHHNIDANGHRCDTASAFLPSRLVQSRKNNLDICVNAIVTHLSIFSSGSDLEVDKVHVEPTIKDGTLSAISANKEIVLCAGSIGTAQLLLLSGIGPQEHLSELGIDVHKDWPIVGSTLQDHMSVPTIFTIPLKDSISSLEKQPTVAIRELLKYQFAGLGMFLCPVHELALFSKSSLLSPESQHIGDDKINLNRYNGENLPDVEIMTIAYAPLEKDKKYKSDGGYSIWATPVRPRSRGSVRLRSKDPRDAPAVDPNHLGDPYDRKVLHSALRLALRLKEQMALNGYPIVDYAVPKGTTDEELDKFAVEQRQSTYHYTSSCRMASDPLYGVVDENLRVHGFTGLRIADASIFPDIVTAHPQATVIAVAEKCVDMLRETARTKIV